MAGAFDSAWLKWGWAVVHAQALQADLADHAARLDPQSFITSRTEYDPKRHCVVMKVDTIRPPLPRWGLRLGDVANNFRASLDHLAWALVKRGKTPPSTLSEWQRQGIYFPICASRDAFKASLEGKRPNLPGVRRADIAIIRRYQPYARGKSRLPIHCLTSLPRMTSDDKHREIRALQSAPDAGELEHAEARDCIITRIPSHAKRSILDVDAEIHRIYVRKTGPNPDIEMQARLTMKPVIDGPLWLDNWLAVTTFHIRNMLREFAEPPEEILTLGIIPSSQGNVAPDPF